MHYFKVALVFLVIFSILLFPFFLVLTTGIIDMFYIHGFGVDSSELVYLGTANGKIAVYMGNNQVDAFNAPTTRSYQITVADDQILCATGGTNYRMDLNGNTLQVIDDPTSSEYSALQFKRSCTAENGNCYRLQKFWGRTRIVCDEGNQNRTVYEMPRKIFATKIILYVLVLGCGISVIFVWYTAIKKL